MRFIILYLLLIAASYAMMEDPTETQSECELGQQRLPQKISVKIRAMSGETVDEEEYPARTTIRSLVEKLAHMKQTWPSSVYLMHRQEIPDPEMTLREIFTGSGPSDILELTFVNSPMLEVAMNSLKRFTVQDARYKLLNCDPRHLYVESMLSSNRTEHININVSDKVSNAQLAELIKIFEQDILGQAHINTGPEYSAMLCEYIKENGLDKENWVAHRYSNFVQDGLCVEVCYTSVRITPIERRDLFFLRIVRGSSHQDSTGIIYHTLKSLPTILEILKRHNF